VGSIHKDIEEYYVISTGEVGFVSQIVSSIKLLLFKEGGGKNGNRKN